MQTFATALEQLVKFVVDAKAPDYKGFKVFEIDKDTKYDSSGKIIIARRSFATAEDYEPRFAELLQQGLPWLNVSCYGIFEERLIIVIETPTHVTKPASRTSINFSGPSSAVTSNGWKASAALAIE